MPELPEVERLRRQIEPELIGRTINCVFTTPKNLREPLPQSQLQALQGSCFVRIRRRGKYLILDLDNQEALLVHLGMTGQLVFRTGGDKHDHIVFELDEGLPLVFNDQRRFGRVLVLQTGNLETCSYLAQLGVEPLSAEFTLQYLWENCRQRKRPIKNLIMDQHVVAGIGNIYASEALFGAGIRPTRAAGRIGQQRLRELVRHIKICLRVGLDQESPLWFVYGRAAENCLVCDTSIVRVKMAGRSTFYCPECQR
ncbi:bifunctional DNA-formamidopyrimidine glycosylase/DNA-(apurinic or apyrimidinic site) lyase [bacterium]|nr:bifunctional DNA-formamidopyrimidine glycosylase/DNA-(apurinic or apyrimidinic site) lyase [bacterium]